MIEGPLLARPPCDALDRWDFNAHGCAGREVLLPAYPDDSVTLRQEEASPGIACLLQAAPGINCTFLDECAYKLSASIWYVEDHDAVRPCRPQDHHVRSSLDAALSIARSQGYISDDRIPWIGRIDGNGRPSGD